MFSCFRKTGLGAWLLFFISAATILQAQPCATLNPTATFTSTGCTVGSSPCALCPGEQFTLNATGSGLQPGRCVHWYYDTTNTFNPYNGEGTLLGCSPISFTPPDPCTDCPKILAIFVDACGTEENNEMLAVWSGSGFAVSNAILDFDPANSGPNINDNDIGAGCNWQKPNANTIAGLQSACPNITVIGVGPGESVPPGVPVIVFTSAGYDANYNFTPLCGLAPVIYVMQNGCTRVTGAFSNSTSTGPRTTIFALNCGCSWPTTYNCGLLVGGNGAYVTDAGFPVTYGNSGCNFPPAPGGIGGGPSPIQIPPFTATVTPAMCNQGPFWVVGVLDTLLPGCNPTFTNYLPFDVVCPNPTLSAADICQSSGPLDLNLLEDPAVPNGTWSGPGVTGDTFDPAGLAGPQQLTFTPTADCGIAATTMVNVLLAPAAVLSLAGPDTLCSGHVDSLRIEFTGGTAPFTFVYSMNGLQQSALTTSDNPYVFSTPILSTGTNVVALDSAFASGCIGTVSGTDTITVLGVPGATIPTDTIFRCSGQADTLNFKFTGPGPYTFQYKVNGDTLPPVTTTDTLYRLPLAPDTGLTVYTLLSVFNGHCSGFVSGTYGIQVGVTPTVSLSGDTMICAGASTPLTFSYTGTPPFVLNYTANGAAQTPDTSLFNPRVILVAPTVPTLYVPTLVSSNGCTGTVSGQAVVNTLPALSATMTGGGQICQGGAGTSISISFQGPGPYTFVYSVKSGGMPATPQPPITTSSNPYSLMVNPPIGTVYQLVSVTNGTCPGTVSGTAVVAVFTPSTATLSGDLKFCNSADTSLLVDFTGSGPFELVYSIDGVAQPKVETFDDPYFIPVHITSTTTYTLVGVESPGCVGFVTGNIESTVTINYPPSYANLKQTCNLVAGTYVVEFDALNATPPFTVVSANGAFAGTHFTSNPIPVAQGYNIVFHDANNCGNVSLNGPSTCNCTTAAGTMNLAPVSACIGSAATAQHNSNESLDNNDLLRFILHTNPALPLGQILAWNTAPSFSFGTGMLPNVTYYISAIAGNPDLAGNVDLNDPCLSVSQGTPVVFYALPLAVFDTVPPVCPGGSINVTVNLTGAPPFSMVYSINGVAQPALTNIATTSQVLNVPVNGPTTLTLNSVSDSHCSNTNTDTLVLALNGPPQISNLNLPCNLGTHSYTVEFDAAGVAPFAASGVIGFFTGNHFTSLPIAANLPYSITVTDANLCGQTLVEGVSNCVCLTQAGTMDLAPLEGCAGTPLTALYNGGSMLDTGDILVYILHTSPDTVLGTVLGIQNQPVFDFNPATMHLDTVYYVSAVAGDKNGNGGVDLSDPCLSISAGTPVLWHGVPMATMDAAFDICMGETISFPVTFTGQAPFQFTYTQNSQTNTVTAIQDTFTISATLFQSTVFQSVSVLDAHCAGTAMGSAAVNVHFAPEIANINVSCAPDNLSYTVSFDVQKADNSSVSIGGNVTGNFDPASGHFVSNPIAPQAGYSAVVTDAWQCGLDSISGGASCACVTNAGVMDLTPISLCPPDTAFATPSTGVFLAPDDTLVYVLVNTPSPTTWTFLAFNSTPTFTFDPATMVAGAPYYIIALAGNKSATGIDLGDVCLTFTLGPTVVWKPEPQAIFVSNDVSVCQGDSTTLSIFMIPTGPYDFTYTVNGVSQSVNSFTGTEYMLTVAPDSTSAYTLGTISVNGCPGTATGTVVVSVDPKPQVQNATTTCDLAAGTYTLRFDINNGATANPTYTVSGVAGTLTDSTFTSAPIPSGQVYHITVSTPTGCTDTLSGTAICQCVTDAGSLMPAGPLSICLPDQAIVQANNDAVLGSGDARQYVLCANPATLPASILTVSKIPQFGLTGAMQTEQTYYIAAMAGDTLANGSIDPADPCLSFSTAVPVVFHNRPTATLAGDTTICVSSNAKFKIQFTGKAPFQFVYAINGNPQAAIAAPQNLFTVSTNNVQQPQVFTLISVQDAFCTGTVSGSYSVTIQEGPKAVLQADTTICPGGTANLALQLSGADTFNVRIDGGPAPIQLSNVQTGAAFAVSPAGTTTYQVGSLSANGNACPADLGKSITVTVAPALTASAVLSDFGGYNLSCPGESDGSIVLSPSGGVPPVSAQWSDGVAGLSRNNLPAGSYMVTLTDQIGCPFLDSFTLIEPAALALFLTKQSPGCADTKTGSITVDSVQGGVGPFALSLDGKPVQTTDIFPVVIDKLETGTYEVSAADINGCTTSVSAMLDNPLPLSVNLGPDTTLFFGDSILLNAQLSSGTVDSFAWSPLEGLQDPASLTSFVKPAQTTRYQIWVRDAAGCTAMDEVVVSIRRDKRLFIPNALQPGSAGNGIFSVFAGPEVIRLKSFRVFDRWGDCVFEKLDILPNRPADGWNGQFRGKDVPPGVYAYVVELEYIDGTSEVKSGDVTVVR